MAEEWTEVAYDAPDKKVGFSASAIVTILQTHSPLVIVRAVVGWHGQIQRIIVKEPNLHVSPEERRSWWGEPQ